jgi:hypothetical protein
MAIKEEFENGPCSESGLVQNILDYGIAACKENEKIL